MLTASAQRSQSGGSSEHVVAPHEEQQPAPGWLALDRGRCTRVSSSSRIGIVVVADHTTGAAPVSPFSGPVNLLRGARGRRPSPARAPEALLNDAVLPSGAELAEMEGRAARSSVSGDGEARAVQRLHPARAGLLA